MNVNKSSFLRICVGLLLVGTTNAARGQTKDPPPDESLRARYESATKLMQDNKPATACPILEEVVAAAPRYSAAKQALADCYVLAGKLLSATRIYEAIEKEAADAGQEVAGKLAADKRHALAPRLSHMRIIVPESLQRAKGLVILRDGEKLSREGWGEAFPADRGPHKIEAQILGDSVWKTVADVWEEGATLEVLVDVHAPFLCKGAECAPGGPNMPPPYWTQGRVAGVVVGALGVAGMGASLMFGGWALAKKNESNDYCNSNDQCDEKGLMLRDNSITYGNIATGLGIAGLVATGLGVTLFAVSSPKKDSRMTVGIGPQSVVVHGHF